MNSKLPTPHDLLNPHNRVTFDATPISLVVIDHKRCIAHANLAAQKLFHWDPVKILGQSAEFLLGGWTASNPAESTRVSALLQLPRGAHQPQPDSSLTRADGSAFPGQIDISPLQTTEGEWLMATVADLTAQKSLEADVSATREQLRAYWEATSQALLTVDSQGIVRMANEAAEVAFGYRAAELVGQSVDVLLPEPLRAAHMEKRVTYFAEPRRRLMSEGSAIQARKKDGTLFHVEIMLTSIMLGDRRHAIALIADLTERKKLERAVEEASAKILLLMESVGTPSTSPGGLSDIAPSKQPDSLSYVGNRDFLMKVLAVKAAAPVGWYVVVITIRHLRVLSERLGKTVAERLLTFTSQYLAKALPETNDALYLWEGASMVALLNRSASTEVRREISDICGRRLEHLMERGSGGSALVLVSLATTTLPVEGETAEELARKIREAARQAEGLPHG
jgi:PAS domain S-box-containing protein